MANLGYVRFFAAVLACTCVSCICLAADDPEVREDCLPFNLDSALSCSLKGAGRSWTAVTVCSILETGNSRRGGRVTSSITIEWTPRASQAVLIPPMGYLLSSGRAPVGSMPGEQCEFFDPGGVSLSQTGEFWSILSGTQVLFDFGNREKGAKQGMLALRHYGFSYKCIVGSTGSSFRYLRR